MIEARRPHTVAPPANDGVDAGERAAGIVREVCPFLDGGRGRWRSARPTRDQRCGAVRPTVPLSVDRQRQLCLTPGHVRCSTYLVAREAKANGAATGQDGPSLLWPESGAAPLVVDPVRPGLRGVPGGSRTGQGVLAGLLVLAFAVVVITRTGPSPGGPPGASGVLGGGSTPGATQPGIDLASPSVAASATPLRSPSSQLPTAGGATPSATPSSAPATPTSRPTRPPATATPAPPATRQYTVKPGDTLSGIAARFGTTVKILAALNNIANPQLIRAGQVLLIP
jgi:LysM repeat protein